MENRFWTVAYRNRDNGQRITAAVFAADQQQAQKKARADGRIDGRDVWEIESIEPHEETLARVLIAEFSKKQQGGHFACPRCGKMTMDAESVTHNALSRRATVYICDACGMQEALEDMMDSRTPLLSSPRRETGAWRREAMSVKRDDELMFYTECWRELRSFLSEVVRDNTGEYPFAQDVLNLMRSIERKYERC